MRWLWGAVGIVGTVALGGPGAWAAAGTVPPRQAVVVAKVQPVAQRVEAQAEEPGCTRARRRL